MPRLLKSATLATLFVLALAGTGQADTDEANHRFSDSLFASGMNVRVSEAGLNNLFAAGETVTLDHEIRGVAHAAGRNVRFEAPVGGGVYGLGYDVEIAAPIAGGATAAGYEVDITSKGSVGGDAILAGRYVNIDGPVAGGAVLTGETVEIRAPISGSAEIRARHIRFGPGATIGGTLTYWSDAPVDVPGSVIAADKVTANIVARPAPPPAPHFIWGALSFLVFFLIAGALFVWILMPTLERARTTLVARPWRTFFLGIVALSALFGSVFVFAVSLIGIPLVPVILLLIPFILVAGYLTSAYVVGEILLGWIRVRLSASRLAAVGAILVGLVALAILHAIPIFGWVVGIVATLLGLGALCQRLFSRSIGEPVQTTV